MKSNFIKYIFFIFVIAIMGFAIYKLNEQKTEIPEEEPVEEAEEETIKEITLGIAEFDTINPILSNNKHVQEISKIIFEPLLEIDSEYKIKNCIAKDWAKTSQTTYLIKIRDDIKWSDGQPLTVEDVIYTIDILKKTPSIYAYNVQYVIRADKIDETSLQITLDHEIPFFEYNLIFPIMSKKYYEGQEFTTTEKNNMPVGSGKYKITRNDAEGITLSKNENYYEKELTLETINIGKYANLGELYNAFKLGKIDLITTTNINIENYIGTIRYNKKEVAGREYDYLAINTQNQVLSHKEVRRAISYGINRENIISSVFNNKYKTIDYPLDYGNWLRGQEGDKTYNPGEAKKLLEEGGWTLKNNRWQKVENNRTLTINLRLVVQATNQTRVTVAEMLKTNLEEIGIRVSIVKASDTQYQNYLQNKNYDIILTGTTESTSPNLETYFVSSNYNNEELNTILNEVKNITDENLLKEKYTRIRQIFNEEQPFIGLYSSYYAVMSNLTLKGNIEANWYNVFIDINNWYKN